MGLKFTHKIPRLRVLTNRDKYLVDAVKGKKVLHGGCVDSGLLHERLGEEELLHKALTSSAKELVGVDVDEEGINNLRDLGFDNVYCADLESWDYYGIFDVIVLGEIIEHVDNCGLFLETIKRFCSEETEVILTTPNAYYYLFWLYSMVGRETIHPDHNYLFSFNSIKFLLGKFGFEVKEYIVLWEHASFVSKTDKMPLRIIKGLTALFVNLFQLLRFIVPRYGNGIVVVAKIYKADRA